jgi:2-oxo-4-hydroxy-4-carboxy-5-ureidoimidazoline decarboxylase
MLRARPLASQAHLEGMSDHVWWHLGDGDWLEAFEHHPRIGADIHALREKFAATATWSAGEQESVSQASEDTLHALAEGNRAYEARYGHIFIVCASGLTAAEMLARLNARMENPAADELRIAAGEQARITRLRLAKLASTHSVPEPNS